MRISDELLKLIGGLPEELQEEGTTGRDLIDNIIHEAHKDGLMVGVRLYAWWKDGIQYVGSTGKTLKEALEEADKDAQALL